MKKTAMKKIAMILLALMTLMTAMTAAYAEQSPWYELSFDDTVLTVRLPGENWLWEATDPDVIELITMETNGDFIASFRSIAGTENNTGLFLVKTDDPAQECEAVRIIDLDVDADNVITINAVLANDPTAEWFEIDEDGDVLTVRLPGDDWTFEILDPDMVELITMETNDAFVASFMSTMAQAGTTQLAFTSGDGQQVRIIEIFVNESGMIFSQFAETFDIFVPAE